MKPENADHALTKALELQAYLELEGRNPIGTASSGSAGVNHMTNQFLTENTAFFDEFVRSLKRDTNNMPQSRNRGSRDNSRNRERDRNNSMDRTSQHDSRDDTRSRYENDTRDDRNTYIPSRNRQDKRDDSRHRYGQRYSSRECRPEQQNRSVRFESPRNDTGQNRQNLNLTAEMHKTDHNHHTKTDDMTLILILDGEARILQTGTKTKRAHTAKELITLPENVKLVLTA